MAALIGLRSIFVLTHDSIGLGEDGPTHQPIEHLASLRLMPNMDVWRPCDTVETAVAWRAAIERRNGPTCLVLTRQDLPHVPRTPEQIAAIARGGYIVSKRRRAAGRHADRDGLRGAARHRRGARARASPASPCASSRCRARRRSTGSPREYRDHVLPPSGARLVIEAGATGGWWRYVGARGDVDRPRSLRPLGARETVVRALRLHRRSRRRGRQAARCSPTFSSGLPKGGIMPVKVAINGYGRIGRNILRALYEIEAHERDPNRRRQRSRRRQDQRASDALRHGARPFPLHGRRRRRLAGRRRRPHQGLRRARSVEAAVGAARRRHRARVHGPVHDEREGRHASRRPARRRSSSRRRAARTSTRRSSTASTTRR